MPRVSNLPLVTSLDLYANEANPSMGIGELCATDDGRFFRYVQAGGADLVIGNLLQAPANDGNFKDMAVQAAVATTVAQSANGGYPIPVTLGGSATTTADQFAGGILVISVTPGIGQVFTILSNDIQSTTNGTCNFYVLEKPQVALTTSSKATAQLNPYKKVIQLPTTHTGIAVGGAVNAIPASNYGFIQSHGMGGVLSDATATSNTAFAMSPSVTTAGTATKAITLQQHVGVSMVMVSVSAQVEPIFWTID